MKSVGEVMAIGRTFRESFAKALRSRELDSEPELPADTDELLERLETPRADRFDLILEAFGRGVDLDAIHSRTSVDLWFLRELQALALEGDGTEGLDRTFRSVDTCAAEFEARTPYFYSGHERKAPLAGEVRRGDRESVVILGSGPNRIGQGIEFDYCCVHAAMTVRASGRDAVMINCNPETVSTDYDTSDRLYFEPLTVDDVLAVIEIEQPEGVIVQFGGQTPLRLAKPLQDAGVRLLGTPVDAIDLAEDRGRFGALLRRLEIAHPPYGTAHSAEEALMISEDVGFPLLVRPSYVLGGRAMEICYSAEQLEAYLEAHVKADQEHPLLLDRFLEDAIEVDVDALCDGEVAKVAGIMQHVEEAGVHSGDSACVIPPMSLGEEMLSEIRATTERLALELGVIGLLNVQYAVAGGKLYVIEANPRASRTVPFVSKAIGAPLAKLACRLMLGETLAEIELPTMHNGHVSVKEAVFPFARFAGADSVLGPEMKSTGEVMGIASDFPAAFGKAQAAAGVALPSGGTVFITVTDGDKAAATQLASRFHDLGFRIIATAGTAQAISRMGIPAQAINKIGEGSPHVVDFIRNDEVDLVINTPTGSGARSDGYEIRSAAVRKGIPCLTTLTGASAAARAISAANEEQAAPVSLQELHGMGTLRSPLVARKNDGRSCDRARSDARSHGHRERSHRRLPADHGARRGGPVPKAGQFYMLSADALGRGAGERPYLPRAFSVASVEETEGGVALGFLLEDVGPGTERLAALAEGEALHLTGPLGRPFSTRGTRAGKRRRRARRRGDRDRAARGPSPRARGCRSSAARAARIPRPSALGRNGALPLRGDPDRERGRSQRAPGLRHRPARRPARGRRCGQRRGLRLRPTGDARGGPRDLCRARCRVRTRDGDADGVRLRLLLRLRGPACVRRLHAPLRRRPDRPRRRDRNSPPRRLGPPMTDLSTSLCGLDLPHPDQRLRHLRRDRRSPRLRRRSRRALPVQRLRLEDDHPGAASGEPAATPLRDARRDDQLDRAAEQGADRLPRARPARARPAPGPADRVGDGTDRGGLRAFGRRGRGPRRGRGDRAQRLLPERQVRTDRRRAAGGDLGALRGAPRG